MSTYICTDCNHSIPAGQAVLRSVSFQRVAYCRPCATDRGIVIAAAVVSAVPARLAS
jgi:hypothetical protein